MKQLSLLFLSFCFFAAGAGAATVSGTVTNSVTGMPQAGMTVMIIDSASSPLYFDNPLTDPSGAYSFTIPASVSTGAFLSVAMTDSCLRYMYATYQYTGASIVKNFSGCPRPAAFYSLQCRFFLPGSSSTGTRNFTGYLISRKYDPVIMDTTLTVIDSFPTISANQYFTKTYTSMPAGTLLLKVALNPGDPEYANYLPTYYDSAVQWNMGRALRTSNFTHPNYTDVYLKRGTNPGGPGFIGGSVLLGANKSTAVGDPLNRRILIVTNATTNRPVAYTYSNAAGKFNIPNLPYATYRIQGDALGKNNPPLVLTLSAARPGYSNILFEENDKNFKGQIGSLGISTGNALAGVGVYPNPAADYVEVSGLASIAGSKTLVLSAFNGAVISRQEIAAGQTPRIATAALAPGIYLLQVQTAEGSVQLKLAR